MSMEQVKMSIDEQTKQTLRQLQETFAELLSPLSKLENGVPSSGAGDDDLRRELQKLGNAVNDSSDDLLRRVKSIEDAQQSIYSRVASIADGQTAIAAKLDALLAALSVAPKAAPIEKTDAKPKAKVSKAKAAGNKRGAKKWRK
ncbi:MAG: hypothetical protein Q4E56_01640 [Pseudomonadota bacterium]|nr:hypothetical protein [Pseudomonadota bacterium]